MIKIESRVLGPVATNCYLIINKDNNESIIVDPADSPESIYDMVVRSASKPQAILLTHGHFDHIGAANEVREHYGIKIYASCDEEKLLASPARNLSNAYGMSLRVTADVLHNDGDILELAGLKIRQSIHRDIQQAEHATISNRTRRLCQVIHFLLVQLGEQITLQQALLQ